MAKQVDPFAKYANGQVVVFIGRGGKYVSNSPFFDEAEYLEFLRRQNDEDLEKDEDPEEGVDYESMTAKEIKALAKEREIDTSGMTKKSEVIAALVAADASTEPEEGTEEPEEGSED